MNPVVLLLKPMIALGTLVMKMLVSVAFLVTEGGEPAQAPHVETEAPIVRVAVSEQDQSLSHMEVELPNGEFYQLAGAAEQVVAPAAASPRRSGRWATGRTHGARSSTTLAMLESETGHSMECHVSLPRDESDGSGVCTTDTGQKYEFAFQL